MRALARLIGREPATCRIDGAIGECLRESGRGLRSRFAASPRTIAVTLPCSTASASLPCLSASAFSPNSSRRQPCSAGTSASSSAAMRSRSSTVAITLAATPCCSDVMRSRTLSSSTVACAVGRAAVALQARQGLGVARKAALDRLDDRHAPARALEALRQRAQPGEPFHRGRRLHRDVADDVVLEHARRAARRGSAPRARARRRPPSARRAPCGLRTRLLSRSQACSGSMPVGVGRGQDLHLLAHPVGAAAASRGRRRAWR